MDQKNGLRAVKRYSPAHFALFRFALGAYLCAHFARMIPAAAELFGRDGLVGDPANNPSHGILPNPLVWCDAPWFVTLFVALLAAGGALLAVGWKRRWTALILWFGWAMLFNRNNLIANPSLPYVGLLLMMVAVVPDGEPWCWRRKVVRPGDWFMPAAAYWGVWFLLAAGYAFGGLQKLGSPSWVNGQAFAHMLQDPLVRTGALRDWLLGLPDWSQAGLTWLTLSAELAFVPLCVTRKGRRSAWIVMSLVHVAAMVLMDFADVSVAMLILHFFVFDHDWMRPSPVFGRRPALLYDGDCGLCNAVVAFAMREDPEWNLAFAPLKSATGQDALKRLGLPTDRFESLVYLPDLAGQRYRLRTDAALAVGYQLGGIWRVVSWLRIVPRCLRDPFYRLLARLRFKLWGGRPIPPLPDPEWAKRILE